MLSWTASQLPSGVLADVPRFLAHQVGPVTSEILETFLGPTASDTTLLGGRGALSDQTGALFSHWSHSSLQTEIQFGFEYRDTWWWTHLLRCLF